MYVKIENIHNFILNMNRNENGVVFIWVITKQPYASVKPLNHSCKSVLIKLLDLVENCLLLTLK